MPSSDILQSFKRNLPEGTALSLPLRSILRGGSCRATAMASTYQWYLFPYRLHYLRRVFGCAIHPPGNLVHLHGVVFHRGKQGQEVAARQMRLCTCATRALASVVRIAKVLNGCPSSSWFSSHMPATANGSPDLSAIRKGVLRLPSFFHS
jgi:hypothetical protein